jgi:hypothetical protein
MISRPYDIFNQVRQTRRLLCSAAPRARDGVFYGIRIAVHRSV